MRTKREFQILSPVWNNRLSFLLASRTGHFKYLPKNECQIEDDYRIKAVYLCSVKLYFSSDDFPEGRDMTSLLLYSHISYFFFCSGSQLWLEGPKHVYPKVATKLQAKQHISPARTAFLLHSVHNRYHNTAVIGRISSHRLITFQSLTRNKACWIKG
jgi:hypothetical protein